MGRRFDSLPVFPHQFHPTNFDATDDGAAGGGSGDHFTFGFCLFPGAPFGDVGRGGEDLLAGDRRGFVFTRGEKGDVVAETGCIDDHEVGARADLLNPADAVGGLGVAVELDFDFAVTACEVARCAAG